MMDEIEIELLAESLTDLQRKVVVRVVSGKFKSNRLAYYDAGGTAETDDSADSVVSTMLSDVKVKQYKRLLLNEIARESIINRTEAMKILSDMARTKITDIAEYRTVTLEAVEGKPEIKQGVWVLKDSGELTPEQAVSIHSVKATSQGIEIKQHDQKTAIKQLSDMEGWNAAKKIEVSGFESEFMAELIGSLKK